MNTADRILIDETIQGQSHADWKSYTSDKNVSYVVDQQNGSYSNQVSFDLSSVVNQNSWMALQEAYVLMPFSTTVASSAVQNASYTSKMLNIKNNWVNYVDSIQCFVNGQQLIDQTSYSNMPINVMDLLTMSASDLRLKGSSLNISPDTTTSIRYAGNTATTGGDGYVNNLMNIGTAGNNTDFYLLNNGAASRNLNFSISPSAITNTSSGIPPALSTSVGNYTQTLAPYFSPANTATWGGSWNYVVHLPLSRLSDLFAKYPLIKGSQIRLVINFNASVSTIANVVTTGAMNILTNTQTAGNTQTALLNSSIITNCVNAATYTITTRVQTTTAAATTTTGQLGYAALPNCRCYVPSYKVNPTYEERLLTNRVQKIRYYDWYQYPIINVANSANYTTQLTTGLPNPQMLVILPFHNGSSAIASNTQLFNTFRGSQFHSVFDTAPSTTCPGAMLGFSQFNVQVSDQNVYNQNQNYCYDNWVQEVQKVGLNGALSKELSSGLVDLTTWNRSPYVITDLSRREETQDGTPQSITVSGSNQSGVPLDYYCFVAFQKEITIDTLTGAVSK